MGDIMPGKEIEKIFPLGEVYVLAVLSLIQQKKVFE